MVHFFPSFAFSNIQVWKAPGPDPVRLLHVSLRHDSGLLCQRPNVQHPALLWRVLLGRNHTVPLCPEWVLCNSTPEWSHGALRLNRFIKSCGPEDNIPLHSLSHHSSCLCNIHVVMFFKEIHLEGITYKIYTHSH